MFGNIRAYIKVGAHVKVMQKQDQRTDTLTEGIKILSRSQPPTHTASRCV